MKVAFTLFFMTISVLFNLSLIQAQDTLPYTFTLLHQEYTPLENPDIIIDTYWDDFDEQVIEFSLGFDFLLFNSLTNKLFIGGDFSDSALASSTDSLTPVNFIFPYSTDLMSRIDSAGYIVSTISEITEGEPGQRIYKAQWSNVGFYNDETGLDFVNFQLWLYEESGDIEFHYGPSFFIQPSEIIFDGLGPLVGLIENYDIFNTEELDLAIILENNPDKPTVTAYFDTDQEPAYLDGQPKDGIVYHFARRIVDATTNTEIQPLYVFPTIVENELHIKTTNLSNLSYQITDMTGRIIVKSSPLSSDVIHLPNLNEGMYIVTLFEGNQVVKTGRFLKQ